MEKKYDSINYNIYKIELMDYLNNRLNNYSKEIIDCFVEYYGEQYRNIITDAYERIVFVFWNAPSSINNYIDIKIYRKSKELTNQCLKDMGIDIEKDWIELEKIKRVLFGIDKEYKISKYLSSNFNDIPILNEDKKIAFKKLKASKYRLFPFAISKKENLKLLDRYLEIIKLYSSKLKEYEENLKEEEEYKIRFLTDERIKYDDGDKTQILKNFANNELIYIYNPHLYYITIDDIVNKIAADIDEIRTLGSMKPCLYIEEKFINMVLIKLYNADDVTIVHEINHCISQIILGIFDGKATIQNGYTINNEKNEFITKFNELITNKISIEITKILHRKGIYLLDKRFDYEVSRTESIKINSLYDNFKEYINDGYITMNTNTFIQRIGKENYDEFLYKHDEFDYDGKKCEKLILKMKEYSQK